jgi:hypothetical protein
MPDYENLRNISGVLERDWRELTPDQRLNVLQKCEEQLARGQRRNHCPVQVYDGSDEFGYFDPNSRGIFINRWVILEDDPVEAIKTIAHEGRHAYQWDCVRSPEQHKETDAPTIERWRTNFVPGNYITFDEDEEGYQNQAVEQDAFMYERRVKEKTYDR